MELGGSTGLFISCGRVIRSRGLRTDNTDKELIQVPTVNDTLGELDLHGRI